MKTRNNLLNKYYRGETSLQEEKELKEQMLQDKKLSAEKDIFGFYSHTGSVPDNLETELLKGIENNQQTKKSVKMWIYRISSAAAVLLIVLSVYLGYQSRKNAQIENDFLMMEQALYQVSESLQPEQENEILVLWVDENVEIIINE